MENFLIKSIKLIEQRYGTADPFSLAEKLNIQVEWVYFGQQPLGKIAYDRQQPIVMLNNRIKHLPLRYFTMAHELGHVILQEGLTGYYTGNLYGHSKLETQADKFASALLGLLYVEENGDLPTSYDDLVWRYGLPK